MTDYNSLFAASKAASRRLLSLTDAERSAVIRALAHLVDIHRDRLLEANAQDLARMDPANPLYDRLQLTPARLSAIADDLRSVAALPSPLGVTLEARTLPNGIRLRRVSVPFGVVGVIYEARPNVTYDVFALCFKTGNAAILKGGSDAEHSNAAAVELIHEALTFHHLNPDAALLLPSEREATTALLQAAGMVDLVIPRGGRALIDFVRDNARVPVIETGAGVVSTYFDRDGDLNIGVRVVDNGKTRRVSVCNALDTLLIHSARLADLPTLVAPLAAKGVELHADARAAEALRGHYPDALLFAATDEDWDREWMSLKLGVRTVDSVDEAIEHIALHGSGHSESIITASPDAAERFQTLVDAACVYVNTPTTFTDGGEFGLGAEIGISTQKLGARGPMGLRELTTYKYLLEGEGQTRS
jgi:glutamate-5-semialdehyde dehydrogenase